MDDQIYSIGDLSRLSGISVRRLRFYSDKGLLPPSARTESGYRMYCGADLARLDLILALRDAGVSLEQIRGILTKRASLGDILALRLQTIEAEIRTKRHIAAALRATLTIHDPTPNDLRRLWTVTRLSQTEFRAAVECFYDEVAGDAGMDPGWKKQMVDAGTPELPDDPTPEQLDAWAELMGILTDTDYVREMRAQMAAMWNGDFDPAAYAQASDIVLSRVRSALAEGLEPSSVAGKEIAEDWLERSARAMKKEPDLAFLDWQLTQYRKHHARSARYQELMSILQGEAVPNQAGREWNWIVEAMKQTLQAS